MDVWFYFDGSAQHGPVSAVDLTELHADGQLESERALLWRDGMEEWMPFAEVPLLDLDRLGKDTAAAATVAPSVIVAPMASPTAATAALSAYRPSLARGTASATTSAAVPATPAAAGGGGLQRLELAYNRIGDQTARQLSISLPR